MDTNEPALAADLGLAEAVRRLSLAFTAAGLPEAGADARLLVLAATGLARADLLRAPERPLGEAAAQLSEFARRRIRREPVSRILGRRWFWSLEFEITADVLDPRPDTETLVEAALAMLGDRRSEALRILDLGVGSGALLCALLIECPHATGLGLDLSPEACRVARRNVERCGLGERACIQAGDWREASAAPFDLIVSNPPYIPNREIADLDPEVGRYDPLLALQGGEDGLAAYRQIASALRRLLKPDGWAVLEIGIGQRAEATRLLEASGLTCLEVRHDLAGVERALLCRLR